MVPLSGHVHWCCMAKDLSIFFCALGSRGEGVGVCGSGSVAVVMGQGMSP